MGNLSQNGPLVPPTWYVPGPPETFDKFRHIKGKRQKPGRLVIEQPPAPPRSHRRALGQKRLGSPERKALAKHVATNSYNKSRWERYMRRRSPPRPNNGSLARPGTSGGHESQSGGSLKRPGTAKGPTSPEHKRPKMARTTSFGHGEDEPSPWQDSRSPSPAPDECMQGPWQDPRSQSPMQDESSQEPWQASGSQLPAQDSQSQSPASNAHLPPPSHDACSQSPAQDQGLQAPLQDSHLQSPAHDARSPPPTHDARLPSPLQDWRWDAPPTNAFENTLICLVADGVLNTQEDVYRRLRLATDDGPWTWEEAVAAADRVLFPALDGVSVYIRDEFQVYFS